MAYENAGLALLHELSIDIIMWGKENNTDIYNFMIVINSQVHNVKYNYTCN